MKVISSKKYYSVYWYPTIFHQEKEHRTVQPEPIDISDESTAHEYYLFIEEEKDPHRKDVYNIHYYLSKNRKSLQEIKLDKKCISFVFQYIKHSRNGFVVYSYDRDALLKAFWDQYGQQGSSLIKKKLSSLLRKQGNPKPTQTEIDNYPVDRILLNCYHHSKNFYHEHEVQEEADGKLEAYYYVLNKKNNKREYLTTVPELFPKNHNVLNWFLDQFEKQFVKYAKQVSKTYRFYSAQVNVFSLLCDRYTEITTSNNKDKIDRLLTILRWQDKVRQLWESNFNSFIESKDYKAFWIENMKSLQKAEIDKEKEEIENLVKLIPTFRINLQYRRLKILETICGNAITEYAYCKTLIESKYNEKYDYSLPVSEKEIKCLIDYYENKTQCDDDLLLRDMCRKKAFNIRNCIRYIEGMRQKCTIWENEFYQELINDVKSVSKSVEKISTDNQAILKAYGKSNRRSEILAWLSVALGFMGLGFSIISFNLSPANPKWALLPIGIGVVIFLICIFKMFSDSKSKDISTGVNSE